MNDLTPEMQAELRRLLDCSSKLPWECYRPHFASGYHSITASDGQTVAVEAGEYDAELIAAAINALPALLDAAAERDALTVAQPCVMRMGEVYDFAWCETHDRTFALGSSCDHAGLSHVDYLDEDGRRQRGRAVLAEMEMERIAAERDALAAKVERVRALPAKHPAGGWYMTSMRDVLAALDEEPQP